VTVRLRSVVVCFFLVGESDSSGKETLVGKESFLFCHWILFTLVGVVKMIFRKGAVLFWYF
jgi:hypothetical protein